ncbi:four-carbon acid sugar kinase family protein [Aurantimonas sp. Leaf443]|uniref:four-carbon acid sugar kinase family protein n=1 Tax=Aurantimonas sp. Leaf443 TaxID=1736378 RepID=UPI0006F22C93|nr:four-carbon acid sugar kinase family protein [Aurantimonas sp. Leaf443]KQT82802.1 Hrp-dependent type III effector protein [Aurantimonas sp. Leaf443]
MSRQPLLIAFYGDDLTGSTDVMEALALRGVETVLFLDRPTPAQRARFPGLQALGIAGTSRSETPDWMDRNLAPAFAWLAAQGAEHCHYKVCSTFDSAPGLGSIGRAIELGRAAFGGNPVPVVVGAPQLKRYTVFGELFAAFRGEVFRIDRHPVMSRHPVTPMHEADLRRHLAAQTDLPIALVDHLALGSGDGDAAVDAAREAGAAAILIDVLNEPTQRSAGRQLRRLAQAGCRFVVGSSGVEYALAEAWRAEGRTGPPARFEALAPVERLAVVSGSCSPTTERQIRHAEACGFEAIAFDPRAFVHGDAAPIAAVTREALSRLAAGRSVIVHTALGPQSDLGDEIAGQEGARHAIGRGLGALQAALVRESGLTRAVIAGGDTSSHALRQLRVFALTPRFPLAETPGSPVSLSHSDDPAFDGLEIALKGGQVGNDDYFVRLRDGIA